MKKSIFLTLFIYSFFTPFSYANQTKAYYWTTIQSGKQVVFYQLIALQDQATTTLRFQHNGTPYEVLFQARQDTEKTVSLSYQFSKKEQGKTILLSQPRIRMLFSRQAKIVVTQNNRPPLSFTVCAQRHASPSPLCTQTPKKGTQTGCPPARTSRPSTSSTLQEKN